MGQPLPTSQPVPRTWVSENSPEGGEGRWAHPLRVRAPARRSQRPVPLRPGLGTTGRLVSSAAPARGGLFKSLADWQLPGLWLWRWRGWPRGVPSSAWRGFLLGRWVRRGPASSLHAVAGSRRRGSAHSACPRIQLWPETKGRARRLSFGGSDGAWESAHTPVPGFLGRKQAQNGEETGPEWGSDARAPPRVSRSTCPLSLLTQVWDTGLFASVGDVRGMGSSGLPRSLPKANRGQFAYFTGFDGKCNYWSKVCTQHKFAGVGWRSKLQCNLWTLGLRVDSFWIG